MAFLDTIKSLRRICIEFFRALLNIEKPDLSIDFVPAITRYFLSGVIDWRVKTDERETQEPQEAVYRDVLKEFSSRVEQSIRQEAKNPQINSRVRALFDKDLVAIKVDSRFTDETWSSPERFFQLICIPGTFKRSGISRHNALIMLCLVWRALQEVALNIVRKDYPFQIPLIEVPTDMQGAIRNDLHRVDELWREYTSPVKILLSDNPSLQIKNANKVETELRLLVARNSGSACLPLRPIPTSPLGNEDFTKPYAGLASDEILRLSRQIRHADGTVLVSGYRGVGKSSFVNRVIYEALGAQEDFPDDEWLIVPVTVNLAKVSGVQNILRVTLRTVRDTLLEEDNLQPRVIQSRVKEPSNEKRLPLNDDEIEHLNEAYLRAAYKVTMGTSIVSQKSREFGSALSIDPGKMLGGLTGLSLGNFLSAAIKRKRVEEFNRQVGYLDYDENAAEEDLRWLIGHLAKPRPYRPGDARKVRVKLVFVFDELDKMDVETGLKPMIEGLKNLFLQQSAVFFLVTSKKFYYDLLKDRAIEDGMLNSYFSAIVNVPLLQYNQAHEMVKNWIFWEATDELKKASPNELELIKSLARVLVYRSFGNPRDMIRELRRMQEWADTQQPFLSDQGNNAQSFQIFAAIQDCVEKTVGQSTLSPSETGAVALVSDRLVGDESRLEQVRRGLYILIEELINRQKLAITMPTPPNGAPPSLTPPTDGAVTETLSPASISNLMEQWVKLNSPRSTSAALSVLEKIQQDNFSLVSLEDVQNLAKRLGGFLKNLHLSLDLPAGQQKPLFEMRGAEELFVTDDFYTLTGRQAVSATAPTNDIPEQEIDPEKFLADAEFRSEQDNWQEKESAIKITKLLRDEQLTPKLKDFLIKTAEDAPDPNYRLMAAERLNYQLLFGDQSRKISQLLGEESDGRVLSVYLNLLGAAPDADARKQSTDAILDLMKADIDGSRRLSDNSAVSALTVLPTVVEKKRDVTTEVLKWLTASVANTVAQVTALAAFTKLAKTADVDPAEKIISDRQILQAFVTDPVASSTQKESELKSYLRDLLRANPLKYSAALLNADSGVNVNNLLAYTLDLAFQPREDALANLIFEHLKPREAMTPPPTKSRLMESIRLISEFETRLLPYLQSQLNEMKEKFTPEQIKYFRGALDELKSEPAPRAKKSDKLGALGDLFSKRTDFFDPTKPGYQIPKAPLYYPTEYAGDLNPTRAVVFSILSLAAFVPGMILFRRDLPAAATFSTLVKSRLLLLIVDWGVFVLLFRSSSYTANRATNYLADPKFFRVSFLKEVARALSAILIALVAYFIHIRFIGPLNQRIQALQFLINLPTIALAHYAMKRD